MLVYMLNPRFCGSVSQQQAGGLSSTNILHLFTFKIKQEKQVRYVSLEYNAPQNTDKQIYKEPMCICLLSKCFLDSVTNVQAPKNEKRIAREVCMLGQCHWKTMLLQVKHLCLTSPSRHTSVKPYFTPTWS